MLIARSSLGSLIILLKSQAPLDLPICEISVLLRVISVCKICTNNYFYPIFDPCMITHMVGGDTP